MNSTCIHYEGSRPEYIHVQVLGNMHKTPYTTGKLRKIHIHLTISTRNMLSSDCEEFMMGNLQIIFMKVL